MIYKQEFPRPDRERASWLNLNGEWDFKLLPDGTGEDKAGGYDKKINVPFSWTSPLSGIHENVKGVGWYSKKVKFEKKGRLFLCFGAVDYIATVYINGENVCTHQGGYNEFDIDVTDVWTDGENEIVVRAEDYRKENQTYGKQGYGDIQGIWQTVWLENRGEMYIDSFRFVTKINGSVKLTVNAVAPDGELVYAVFDKEKYSAPVKKGVAKIEMDIDEPQLWSPEDPNLYEGTIKIGDDVVNTYFGIREIKASHGRIYLNDYPIYINGTLDQAFNPQGHFTYPSDEDMRLEAWRLKRLGLNMARIHIKAEEPRKLYWMDKYGILIMQDMPCFWGEPDDFARSAYENEWRRTFDRDYNHPCIFSWVMFNETWGLFTGKGDDRSYLPETQEWVRSVYRAAKKNDPTRLIEDNSACNNDHVESDINTWHFYINGYKEVKEHIENVVANTKKGSDFNYTEGNCQSGAPLMNSECGMVWGVDGSAGDSDIAWQYHYMLNEFRLHDKINGFIFTEFHDVVNEFNGYYRIDDKDKEFGYDYFARGMKIKDMHCDVFAALDCPPCRTVKAGEVIDIPFGISDFSCNGDEYSVFYELWHDTPFGKVVDYADMVPVETKKLGFNKSREKIIVQMPDRDCLAILSVYVYCDDELLSRNFTTFDVETYTTVAQADLASAVSKGFDHEWKALSGEKLCFAGKGEVSFEFDKNALIHSAAGELLEEMDQFANDAGDLERAKIFFEAGAKRVLSKDIGKTDDGGENNFMRGYLVDRGSFPNSYFMTDDDKPVSNMKAYIDGVEVYSTLLLGDNADARGVLSWHYQKEVRKLDEAGSYGQLVEFDIPSNILGRLGDKFTLTLKVDNGLAIYGRKAGKYGFGVSAIKY